ncbi:MAG: tetratricopeptide repeat protein [Phycisphaerae bacterium]|nr:tetratricopeptide repeat protein [Phycisphaerae bacterium]
MKRTGCLLVLILPLILISGCIQGQATLSLNPDGSGSVRFEGLYNPYLYPEDTADIRQTFRVFIQQFKNTLTQSGGIDTWKDVNWRILEDGRFYFAAEAYFKSIDKIDIRSRGVEIGIDAFCRKDKKQPRLLELKPLDIKPKDSAEQDWYIAKRYDAFRQAAELILQNLRVNIIINLPAEILDKQGFETIDSQTVQYAIEGARLKPLFQFINARQGDAAASKWNYDPVKFLNYELLPRWLADKPLKVEFADSKKPIFNYGKAVSAARKEYKGILERLESAETIIPAPTIDANQPPAEPNAPPPDDSDMNARLRAGLFHESKEQYAEAVEIYSAIIDDSRADAKHLAGAYYRRGICLFEQGDSVGALTQFNYVLTNFPLQRVPALRSLKMLQDIRTGVAKRRADNKQPDPPSIVATEPFIFTDDVNSAVDKITVRFSEPMEKSSWFYSSFAPASLPRAVGEPVFDPSGRIWTLPVKLAQGRIYAIAFNSGDTVKDIKNFRAGFRSVSGRICRPFVLVFSTAAKPSLLAEDANDIPTPISDEIIKKVEEINAKQ